MEIVDSILQEGMEEGVFYKEMNSKLIRQMIFGTLDEVVTNWVMKEQKYDLVSQVSDVHHFIIHGLKNK